MAWSAMDTRLLKILETLLQSPIAFHLVYLRLINRYIEEQTVSKGVNGGNASAPAAAIMLSQAWYWHKRMREKDNGWFYISQAEWTKQTALTVNNQNSARKLLCADGMNVLETDLRGVPATLYYRVKEANLFEQLLHLIDEEGLPQFPSPQETGGAGKQVSWGTDNFNRNAETKQRLNNLLSAQTKKHTSKRRDGTSPSLEETLAGFDALSRAAEAGGKAWEGRHFFEHSDRNATLADRCIKLFGVPMKKDIPALIAQVANLVKNDVEVVDLQSAYEHACSTWKFDVLGLSDGLIKLAIKQSKERKKTSEENQRHKGDGDGGSKEIAEEINARRRAAA